MGLTPNVDSQPARLIVTVPLTDNARRSLALAGKAAPPEVEVVFEYVAPEPAWDRLVSVAHLAPDGTLRIRLSALVDAVPSAAEHVVTALETETEAKRVERAAAVEAARTEALGHARQWLERVGTAFGHLVEVAALGEALVEEDLVLPGGDTFGPSTAARWAQDDTGERAAPDARRALLAMELPPLEVRGLSRAQEAVQAAHALAEATAWVEGLDPGLRGLEEVQRLQVSIAERRLTTGRRGSPARQAVVGLAEAAEAVARATADAEAAAQRAADEAWVAAHGSARLKRIVAEGFLADSAGVLRDERLAAERPGWSWLSKAARPQRIINPTDAALDLLAAARASAGAEAALGWLDNEPVVTASYLGAAIVLYPPSSPNRPGSDG